MGCDIHLMAEIRANRSWFKKTFFPKKSHWINIDKWSRNPDFGKYEDEPEMHIAREDRFYTGGRNYNLFSALCGVRSSSFTGNTLRISNPKGIPKDASPSFMKYVEDYGSDGHSHNWNTLRELEEFDWSSYGETCDDFRNEVIPKMRRYCSNPDDVRIVYFFDN